MDFMTLIYQIIGTLLFAILAGIVVWYLTSRHALIRQEIEKLKEARKEIYLAILNPYVKLLSGLKTKKNEKAVVDRIVRELLSEDYRMKGLELNLIGSDDVIRALNDMMQWIYKNDSDKSPEKIIELRGGLQLAIRKDLNSKTKYKKTKLKSTDMLRATINDLDEFTGGTFGETYTGGTVK